MEIKNERLSNLNSQKTDDQKLIENIDKTNWESAQFEMQLREEQRQTKKIEKQIIFLGNEMTNLKTDFKLNSEELIKEIEAEENELKANEEFLEEVKKFQKNVALKSLNSEKMVVYLENMFKSEENYSVSVDQFISKFLQGCFNSRA